MRVILAIDGSEGARGAQDMVLVLPLPRSLLVTVVTVLDVPQARFTSLTPMARRAYHGALAAMRREAEDAAHKVLGAAREAMEGRGVRVTTRIKEGPAAAAIIQAADLRAADLVVVGSHGLGPVKEFLLGSVSQKVARYAPCFVLIVKRAPGKVRRVLLGVDGSCHAEAALKFLAGLPLPSDATVHICAVAQLPTFLPPNAGRSREPRATALRTIAKVVGAAAVRVLAEARALLARNEYAVTASLRVGHAAGHLLAGIREFRPDLVVIGAKGRTAVKWFALGSVAQKVVKYAPCSVLVVRP